MKQLKQIYKITYPNGKIYIGKDLTGNINYLGSANSKLIENDFANKERHHFIITKDILYESFGESDSILNKKEVFFIKLYRSNDPQIGYNRIPKRIEKK